MAPSTSDGNTANANAPSQRQTSAPCVEQHTGRGLRSCDILYEVPPPYPRQTVNKEQGVVE
jgi:hypothetical protein